MNDDLKWLAENVHEWSEGYESCDVEIIQREITASFRYGPSGRFNQSQWQAARDELSGKPGWDDAPEWAEWIAQSPRGHWECFEKKPVSDECAWHHAPHRGECVDFCRFTGKIVGDWRNTLERRPEYTMSQCPADQTEFIAEYADSFNKLTSEDIKKLVNERKQWSGPEDGVPPVGQWVQFKQIDEAGEDLDGLECYVISNGTDESGYKVTTVYFEQHGYKAFMSCCFRPIRTEEDKAVEEMMRIYHANESVSVRDAMRDIYRAGYHKQEDE